MAAEPRHLPTPEGTRAQVRPSLVAVAGPPGAGKTSAVTGVLASCAVSFQPPIVSTRPPRPGEERSGQYLHLTRGEYELRQKRGEFLASYRSFGKHLYGVTRAVLDSVPDGAVPLMEVEPRNIRQLRRDRRVIAVLIIPQHATDLLARLRSRGIPNDGQDLSDRWLGGIDLLEFDEPMDYILINAVLESTISELRGIVEGEWLAAQNSMRMDAVRAVVTDMRALHMTRS